MKITIATGLYPPEIGGPATHTVLLEKELQQRGYKVEVVPFSVSRHLPKIIRHLHYLFQVYKKARSSEIIFAQDVVSVGLPALLAARLARAKFFVRVPGDYAWEQSTQRFGVQEGIDDFQNKSYGWRVNGLKKIQSIVTGYADVVITPSDYFKHLVIGWGVKPEKVHRIYNGVNLNIVPKSVIKPAPLVLLSAGRLVEWKGFDTLIKIMKKIPNWKLVILGEGPDQKRLEGLVKDNLVANRVEFKGSVSREEVFGWCQAADAFVLNTRFESFSYQIVEAMSAGIPVITTKIGSLPELIHSGEHGVLLRPDDEEGIIAAIESVVINKAEWKNITIAAQVKADKFSVDNTIDALCELMLEVTGYEN